MLLLLWQPAGTWRLRLWNLFYRLVWGTYHRSRRHTCRVQHHQCCCWLAVVTMTRPSSSGGEKIGFENEAGEEMESCIYGRSLPSLSLSLTTHTRTKITNFRHKTFNDELLGYEFCSLFSLNSVARSCRLLRKGRVGAHKRVADSPFCSGLFYW